MEGEQETILGKRIQAKKPPSTTKRVKLNSGHRQWKTSEVEAILEFMKRTITLNQELEKPTATAYYDRMMMSLGLKECSNTQLKNKVRHMRDKYTKAVEWKNATGSGVLETDGEQSVLHYIRKICPHWDLLDEIYGAKASIQPPFVYESGDQELGIPDLPIFDEIEVEQLTNESSNLNNSTNAEKDVSSIQKQLSSTPKSYKRTAPRKESYMALTEAQNKRAEALAEKVKIDGQRLEFDNRWKVMEFEFKEKELSLKRDQLAADERIRKMQLEKEERMEMFKIEQETKLQLELAKLKNG